MAQPDMTARSSAAPALVARDFAEIVKIAARCGARSPAMLAAPAKHYGCSISGWPISEKPTSTDVWPSPTQVVPS